MKVTIDKYSGFCWGVIRTIEIAEKILDSGETLYSLGEVIHNPVEIERLKKKGLVTVTYEDLKNLKGKKVLIRAHGEPPSTYEYANKYGVELIDGTCPVVAKLQERIRKFYEEGYQIIIFGKSEHPEVFGLVGHTNGEAIVIKSKEELSDIKLSPKVVMFSQTTMDKSTFYAIKNELSKKIRSTYSKENTEVEFYAKDTICGQVSGRENRIREFAKTNDIIIFVAGRYSSNGKVLFEIVKSVNPRSQFIEDVDELKDEWFIGIESVGVTGATSTPQWLMEKVKSRIEEIDSKLNKNKFIQPLIINETLT